MNPEEKRERERERKGKGERSRCVSFFFSLLLSNRPEIGRDIALLRVGIGEEQRGVRVMRRKKDFIFGVKAASTSSMSTWSWW